jgi:NAD(P)-dependent dehydrogenase (short-subunit alcohol dehydrogenase family)
MAELEGKVAVITGAGSGMGRAAAQVFVREGAKVLAADISGGQDDTAAALGDGVVPFQVDVTDEAAVEAMFAAAAESFGRVDAVLNVAGIGAHSPLADTTVEDYERVMAVNLKGVMLGTKHALRTMIPTGGGAILNWSSTGGMNGSRLPTSVYSAAKAGVISFTKAAAIEYGTQGIRANAICPGFIETEMSGGKGAAERFPALVQGSALRRGGQPEEVAELASFLASDRATFITGAVVAIDGGSTCTLPS